MGTPDVCYQSAVGLYHAAQECYLSGVVRTGFHHSNLVISRNGQQCQGHSDMVVEIALSVTHSVFPAEHRSRQFLRGGLAVGACHLNHRYSQLLPVVCGKPLQRLQHIIHQNIALIALLHRVPAVHHHGGAALFQCGRGICIAVEALSLQRKEQTPRLTFPRVGCHLGVTQI